MKRYTLMIAALFVAGTVMSQDLTSKKGEMYLPEAGDYAIGIDATPILNYFGNFIGGQGSDDNGAPFFNAHPNELGNGGLAIYGKQFIDANTAYRAKARVGFGSTNNRTIVDIYDAGGITDATGEDALKTSNFGITLGAGLEKRRGNTRLQGVYGAEAMIGFGSSKTTNEFANTAEFDPNGSSRITEIKNGSTLMFGVNGFVGAEYFFAPKMSVAGEYTWGLGLNSTGDGEVTVETYNAGDDTTTTDTAVTGGASSFGIDTGVLGSAQLRLMFHF